MIEEFQCPGCVCGSNTKCGNFRKESWGNGFRCVNHVPGTTLFPGGRIFLGMPKGFNKVGPRYQEGEATPPIVLFSSPEDMPMYDFLNVPVWGLEQDGYLFLRVYSPRINFGMIHVCKDATLNDIKGPAGCVPFDIRDDLEDID